MAEALPDSMANDLAEAERLVADFAKNVPEVSTAVQSLLQRVKKNEFQTEKGLDFLELKNHMLLSYLTNLTFIIMRKISGKKIENNVAIENLVEIRTVLEKMRPIDVKLQYNIQKLLKTARTGDVARDDPLHFRANPDNLMDQNSDVSSHDESDSDEDTSVTKKKETKSDVYVPPKISAMYYEGDETEESRKKKMLEQIQKRALSSSMLQELRNEYDLGPEEIKETSDLYKQKVDKEMKERARYEEEYMMRLPMTKKQKHEAKKLTTMSTLSSLAKFDDISALELGVGDITMNKKKKKHNIKLLSKKKSKKGRKNFRRK